MLHVGVEYFNKTGRSKVYGLKLNLNSDSVGEFNILKVLLAY